MIRKGKRRGEWEGWRIGNTAALQRRDNEEGEKKGGE